MDCPSHAMHMLHVLAMPWTSPSRAMGAWAAQAWRREWPRLSEAHEAAIDIVQLEGEVIFVPSGWYHQVHNLVDTISINHNWLSAPGLMSHVAFISRELARARGERGGVAGSASELDAGGEGEWDAEWDADCQRKLRAHTGTDVPGLLRMLDHFAQRAAEALTCAADEGAAAGWAQHSQRLRARQRLPRFELRQIARALSAVLADAGDKARGRDQSQSQSHRTRRPMITGWWRGEAEQLLERLHGICETVP